MDATAVLTEEGRRVGWMCATCGRVRTGAWKSFEGRYQHVGLEESCQLAEECCKDAERYGGHPRGVWVQNVTLTALPRDLLTVDELVHKVPLSKERIKELTDGGYMPCWFVDGSVPLYKVSDVRRFIAENLVTAQQPREYPRVLQVLIDKVSNLVAPTALKPMADKLYAVPMSVPGVYFLVQGDEVVYVGQSVSVAARIGTHVAERKKEFERALFIPIPKSDLTRVEGAFIRSLSPKYNANGSCDPREQDIAALRTFKMWEAQEEEEAQELHAPVEQEGA